MKIIQETPFDIDPFGAARGIKIVMGLPNLAPAAPARPTVGFVSTWNTVTGGGTTTPTLNAVPNVAGNLIVLALHWFSGTVNNSNGISDTATNTYTFITRINNFGDILELWLAPNIKASASNVIMATFGATVGSFRMRAAQIATSAGPASYASIGVGTTANPSVLPTITTNRADQLIVAAYCINSGSADWAPASGWTEIGDDSVLAMHALQTAAAGLIITPSATNTAPAGRTAVAGLFSL